MSYILLSFVITMIQYSTLNCNGRVISLQVPKVLGVVNLTVDSFYAGSRVVSIGKVLDRIAQMQKDGATMIDLGAMSSRPGADIISSEEEWSRISQVFFDVRTAFPELILSVDTVHSDTAEKVLDLGADIINDISAGLFDDSMMAVVGRYQAPYVIMHMKGLPSNMQHNPEYENVVTEVFDFFVERIEAAAKSNIVDLILDPGFGFGKRLFHNYSLLKHLKAYKILRYPVLVGVSRKGMIQKVLDVNADKALNGTTAVHMMALLNGAKILRVHDVKEAVECIRIWEKFNSPDV